MKLSRIVAVVFFSLVFALNASAQRNWSAEADEAFDLQQFALAIDRYKVAITKIKKNKPEKARLTYRIAECYRYMNDPKQQEIWYKKAIAQKHDDPLAVLYYANALKVNEKYPEAIIQYNVYKNSVPSDPRGENGAKSCELAQKWKDNPTRFVVENMKQFNSKEMDFSPTYADKKYKSLIFTSAREGAMGGDLDEGTGQQFTDLFLVTQDKKGKWSTPVILPEPISSKFNEGAACMNDKGTGLFFTRCGVEKKKKMGCQIYFAQKKGPNWDFPELITLSNDTSASALTFGHPSISSNELTLYFASDMPGGQGGKDIWCVKRTKKNKPWGKPENLGPVINTAGDEMFPYIHDNGTLYFSSNYHLGMGGMDIFKAEPKPDGSFGAPENMKFPMNSPGDDFGITFKGASVEEGYFTSNRKGGKGSDDIWYFSTPPIFFTLKGVVTDDSTKQIITGAIIKCVGSDGTIIYDTTDVTGGYFFSNKQILPNTSYDLLASKEGYYSAKGKESTVGFEQSRDLVHDFQLKPIPKIPIVLPDILYDLARWELKTQYQDSLNGLYQTLIDNPNIVIELGSHTDSRPIPMTNDTLSLRRAQSVVDYLISKGIEGDRMQARGYGQKVPRTLHRNMMVVYKNKTYSFNKGVKLTDGFIDSLKTYEEKEAAHQLNRRTEFKIISEKYVPKKNANDSVVSPKIKLVNPEDEEIEKDEEGSGTNDVNKTDVPDNNTTTPPVNNANNKATNTNTNTNKATTPKNNNNKTPNKPK